MCHFHAQNCPFFMSKIFFVQTIITFIYLLALFIVQNLKKFLQQIQSHENAPFLGPKWFIFPNNFFFFFFWKIINIILIYLLAPFIVQNFKKILPVIRMCNFWAQNSPFPQMRIFRKSVNEPFMLHKFQTKLMT